MPGPRLAVACALAALVSGGTVAAPARALVAPAQLLDGPSAAIREIGGVAMSADGSGGIVYRKDDGGRPHIYAAQYVAGAWRAPQRVDTGPSQGFESAWPAIAAGDGGRLLVVWTQEFGAADRLYSAALQPGARRFEAPVPVDLNIGEMSLGTWPAVSMAPGGQAYLAYRVITDPEPSTAPAGSVLGEYRIARFNGQLWSGFGIPVNRNLESAQSTPSAGNRPRIGVDQLGNAVMAWEERDDQFVPRIYARRVFPSSTGIALQVTPATIAGAAVGGGASQFALSVGRFGEAAVAWRQDPAAPGSGGAFSRARLLVAQSPDEYSPAANAFAEPRAFDGGGADGPASGIGAVTVAASGPAVLAAFGQGGAALAADGDDQAAQPPVRIDDGGGQAPTDPVATLGSSGSAALAWKRNAGARGGLVVLERRTDGVTSDRRLAAPRGGVVDDVQLGGSGLGDALVGWSQGTAAGRQIAASAVDAPPDAFNVQTPIGWFRGAALTLRWDPAPHAIGGVRYAVVIDGDTKADGLTGTTRRVRTSALDDGARTVTVVATDSAGQETTSVPATLKVDRRAPRLRLRLRGRVLSLRLTDAGGSGTRRSAVAMSFGDGARVARRGSASHRYPRPGRYRVVVRSADRAGNRVTARRVVRIR